MEPRIGDVVILTEGPKKGCKIKLASPVTKRDMAYGTRWDVPGWRWIESRQQFSSNLYVFSSDAKPSVISGNS